MSYLSDAEARAHLRLADGEDDGNLALYIAAAEQFAQQFMNRNVYADTASCIAAAAAAPAAFDAAAAAYTAAMGNLPNLDPNEIDMVRETATAQFNDAKQSYAADVRSIPVNENIKSATLIALGHRYAIRQDVVADYRIVPTQIPQGAQLLLMPYRIRMGVT